MKNKKAVSPIIASVLLIAITLILGIIIYNFSANFAEKQKAETGGFSNSYDVELSQLGELAAGPTTTTLCGPLKIFKF